MAQGCCSYGAHFTDDEDLARVKAAAKTLTDEQWQFAAQGPSRRDFPARGRRGSVTRLVEDACIFLNRPGFPGGPGCALHRAALEQGDQPMDLKPDVCWQLPLRREDTTNPDGSVTSVVGQWDRRHWGAGGEEFAWWCTEAPEAFRGGVPVWRHMRDELAPGGPRRLCPSGAVPGGPREKGAELSPTPPPTPATSATRLASVGGHERKGTLEIDARRPRLPRGS